MVEVKEVPRGKQAFAAGFKAIVPMWIGAFPFAVAYTIAARQAGLDGAEIQLMSLCLSSAGVQLSVVSLVAAQASAWLILVTALTLSVQLILYGITLQQKFGFSGLARLLAGGFLIDGAYAVTIVAGKSGLFLIGAELSMYFIWNASTFAGLVLQGFVGNFSFQGLDFIFPVMFLVVLVPLVRRRLELLIVLVAGVAAWVGGLILPSGLTILATALFSGALGTWLSRRS